MFPSIAKGSLIISVNDLGRQAEDPQPRQQSYKSYLSRVALKKACAMILLQKCQFSTKKTGWEESPDTPLSLSLVQDRGKEKLCQVFKMLLLCLMTIK